MAAEVKFYEDLSEWYGQSLGEYCGSLKLDGARVDLFRDPSVIRAYITGGDVEVIGPIVSPHFGVLEDFAAQEGRRLRVWWRRAA